MAYQDAYKDCMWMDFETLERFMKDALVCFGVPEAHRKDGEKIDYVCCIYATAPFVKAEYIIKGYKIIVFVKLSTKTRLVIA